MWFSGTNIHVCFFSFTGLFQDLRPIPPPDKSKEDILLFFKLYDPEKAELRYLTGLFIIISFIPGCFMVFWHFSFFHVSRYVGRLFLKSSSKPIEIIGKLNQMAGFDPDEEIELYEVRFPSGLFNKVSFFCILCFHFNLIFLCWNLYSMYSL